MNVKKIFVSILITLSSVLGLVMGVYAVSGVFEVIIGEKEVIRIQEYDVLKLNMDETEKIGTIVDIMARDNKVAYIIVEIVNGKDSELVTLGINDIKNQVVEIF